MSVRELTESEKALLNNDSGLLGQVSMGSNLQEMQKAINAGGGGGLPVASQAEAEAGVVNDKTMTPLRTLQSINANAPGGGSAYPDNVTPVAVSTTLTPAEQGIVLVTASGVTLTLPATAVNGTTYKIVPITSSIQINTNGAVISDLGAGILTIDGNPINIVAVNITPWPGLVWWLQRSDVLARVYNVTAAYPMCAIVEDSGDFYMSRVSNNVGQALTSVAHWYKLTSVGHAIEDEGMPLADEAIMNFVGAGVFVSNAGGKTIVTVPGQTLGLPSNVTGSRAFNTSYYPTVNMFVSVTIRIGNTGGFSNGSVYLADGGDNFTLGEARLITGVAVSAQASFTMSAVIKAGGSNGYRIVDASGMDSVIESVIEVPLE